MDDLERVQVRLNQIPEIRQREVAEPIAKAQARGAELDAEEKELRAAERAILRLRGGEVRELPAPPTVSPRRKAGAHQKPPGTPSVTEMIGHVLIVAHFHEGIRGLEPLDMTSRIRERYQWHSVAPRDVGPIAWRMWKRGELVKDGATYAVPEDVIKGFEGIAEKMGPGVADDD